MIWIVLANGNLCRIFLYEKNPRAISLVQELSHPESRLKGIDLVSDSQGHYETGGMARGKYSSREEPHEVEIDRFAQQIAKLLDHGRVTNQYDQLILVAPPHMNGLIHQHLNKNVSEKILTNLNKDYIQLTEKELLASLQEALSHRRD